MVSVTISLRGKKLPVEARRVEGFGRVSGLMFRPKCTDNLLFEFNRPIRLSIHSFFVSFPFLAVWLDSKNRVMEFKMVKPWTLRVCPERSFSKLLEIPFNFENLKTIEFFVGKRKI